ncbi:hypothetical protein ANO11243_031670 [Dothideomycetidae sp. 11243]|nr:hypothetical protein ANO11243_031670 [fungal sp. No.11243]
MSIDASLRWADRACPDSLPRTPGSPPPSRLAAVVASKRQRGRPDQLLSDRHEPTVWQQFLWSAALSGLPGLPCQSPWSGAPSTSSSSSTPQTMGPHGQPIGGPVEPRQQQGIKCWVDGTHDMPPTDHRLLVVLVPVRCRESAAGLPLRHQGAVVVD